MYTPRRSGEFLPNERIDLELVGPSKSLFEKGGSLAVCIPSRIVRHLKLSRGDQLVFMLDKRNNRMIVGKKEVFQVKVGEVTVDFSFPFTRDEIRKLSEGESNGSPRDNEEPRPEADQ
jgi:bifunctional DNA-binding transcriptional regulator/antitoxin component of YhaV-PrlF toxin-antitoxin module